MATKWKMGAEDFLTMLESKSATPKGADVTPDEQLTEAERAAIRYCEKVAREREAGIRPASYTSTTTCRGFRVGGTCITTTLATSCCVVTTPRGSNDRRTGNWMSQA